MRLCRLQLRNRFPVSRPTPLSPQHRRTTSLSDLAVRLLLAGFCPSLVGLKFPRSGHCLSDGAETTTRYRPAYINNLRSSCVASSSESSLASAPLGFCRQNRFRVQLHRRAIVRHPHLSVLDGVLQLHAAGGKRGEGARACLGKIDDRELVRSRELVADLLPPDLRGVATVAQCYPCPLSQCSARVPSCVTINREFCKAQRAGCGDDRRGSPYRC